MTIISNDNIDNNDDDNDNENNNCNNKKMIQEPKIELFTK